MRKTLVFFITVCIFLVFNSSIFAIGESSLVVGGSTSWRIAETRNGVTEALRVRPNPVLILSSASSAATAESTQRINFNSRNLDSRNLDSNEPVIDMHLSFDEAQSSLYRDSAGYYRVRAAAGVETAGRSQARSGAGAAYFSAGNGNLTIEPDRGALFTAGTRLNDFTLEFWLYPLNLENGERIFSFNASKQLNGNFIVQRIQCLASRNRLQWSFTNFFTSTDERSHINIEFSGNTPVVPRTWSHHLIRFDAATGLIEYLVDGNSEAISYATATRRENNEVFRPVIGTSPVFSLGEYYTGLIDEFKIHRVYSALPSIQRYPSSGRMETRAIDLGVSGNLMRIDVTGGRINGASNFNEFRENGRFRFSDDSQMHFFIRAGENPYMLNNSRWVSFTPGADVSGIQGRYVQIAADFYPSADGNTSPYLEQMQIVYMPFEAPMPPRNLSAVAVDGAVQLRWRHSLNDTVGYLVYYSPVRGELFGEEALLGPSPIDVGYTNSLLIEGLRNGTLYYFRVAAYNTITGQINYNVGEFSAEVTARPLSGLSLSDLSP